jgi:hypothetical protein
MGQMVKLSPPEISLRLDDFLRLDARERSGTLLYTYLCQNKENR